MKKFFAVCMSLLLVLSASACVSGTKKESPSSQTVAVAANKIETTTPTSEPMRQTTPAPTQGAQESQSVPPASEAGKIDTGSWASFYTAYSERLAAGVEKIGKFEDTEIIFSMLDFVAGEIDLAMTATFFEKDAASTLGMVFSIFGYKDVKYEEAGDTASVNMKSSEGKERILKLRYDGKNTAECVSISEGKEDFTISICALDDFIARSYKNPESNLAVHIVLYKNGDVDFGSSPKADAAVSLYGNESAAKDPAFISAMEKKFSLKDGKLIK